MSSEAPPLDRVLEDLVGDLRAAWERSDALFGLLEPAAWLARPIALRHPFAFYAGHLPAFAWNQIGRGVLSRPPIERALDALYARGIDPMEEAAAPGAAAWPSEREAFAYRDRARAALLDVVGDLADVAGGAPGDPLAAGGRALHLVLEHEQMHHETLLYMIAELPHRLKRTDRVPRAGTTGPSSLMPGWARAARGSTRVSVPAGRAVLGADFEAVPFGWDNEFPEHEVDVEAFAIDALPVRVGEYLEFVEAGGYRRSDLFDADDWAWLCTRGMDHPYSWRRDGQDFLWRGPFDDRPLADAMDFPVQVSFCEAQAYARWRGATLPTEAQVHRAAFGTPTGETRMHPWGDEPPSADCANLGFVRWGPAPVGSTPAGASAFGVHELVGNGWEWTSSVFAPFPGFAAWARTYPGYSKDFFDGEHRVLLGGSWATDARLVRRSFRNWFQPRYPHVFSKFRCVSPA